MKQLTIFLVILFNSNLFGQDIKWNTVTKNEYNPIQLISRGVVTLDNGDKTPEADLYIDFMAEEIYYRNPVNNAIFSIYKNDMKKERMLMMELFMVM